VNKAEKRGPKMEREVRGTEEICGQKRFGFALMRGRRVIEWDTRVTRGTWEAAI